MPDAKNPHEIEWCIESVERDVAGSAPRNDQFPQLPLHPPSDQWMPSEYLHRGADTRKSFQCRWRILCQKELGDALQVGQSFLGVDYLRHCRARGRVVFLPARRAPMYA